VYDTILDMSTTLQGEAGLRAHLLGYLAALKGVAGEDDAESYEIVLDTLGATWGLNADAAQPDMGLLNIYNSATSDRDSATPPAYVADTAMDADVDPRRAQFLSMLRERGYFGEHQEGSAEHTSRVDKANQLFNKKYNEGGGSRAEDEKKKPVVYASGLSEAEAKAKATEFKLAGNAYLKQGDLLGAIGQYTEAIDTYPTAVYHSNRAAALISLKKYKEAVADCHAAIALDADYAKAHYRLGAAMVELGQLDEAVPVYTTAIQKCTNAQSVFKGTIETQLGKLQTKISARDAPSMPSGGGGGQPDFASVMQGLGPMLQGLGGGAGGMDFGALLGNPMVQGMMNQMASGDVDLGGMLGQLGGAMGAMGAQGDDNSVTDNDSSSSFSSSSSSSSSAAQSNANANQAPQAEAKNMNPMEMLQMVLNDESLASDPVLGEAIQDIKTNGIMAGE
jgi:tetratricopeptide (TPR) repeat protein